MDKKIYIGGYDFADYEYEFDIKMEILKIVDQMRKIGLTEQKLAH